MGTQTDRQIGTHQAMEPFLPCVLAPASLLFHCSVACIHTDAYALAAFSQRQTLVEGQVCCQPFYFQHLLHADSDCQNTRTVPAALRPRLVSREETVLLLLLLRRAMNRRGCAAERQSAVVVLGVEEPTCLRSGCVCRRSIFWGGIALVTVGASYTRPG